jgi:phosphatidylinositol alpha-1,6-mannosyltransferase
METWHLHLISGLARQHRITVIAPEEKDWRQLYKAGAQRLVTVPDMHGMASHDPWALDRLVTAAVRDAGVELAHLANTGLSFLVPGLARAAIPTIVTVHGNDMTRPWLGLNLEGAKRSEAYAAFLGMATRVSAVSQFSRNLARTAGVPGTIAIIPPAVDIHRFRPGDSRAARHSLGLPAQRTIMLSVSRLKRRKGLHDVVSALPALSRWSPLHVIVGAGEEESTIIGLAHELGVRSQVELRSNVSPEQLPLYYQAADVFVLPVLDRWDDRGRDCEGFGIVYLEAAACGLPCVASCAGGAPEAVADGQTGLLVPAGNVAALGAALSELLADPVRAAALGTAGRRRVEAGFTIEHLARRFEALYTEAIGDRSFGSSNAAG